MRMVFTGGGTLGPVTPLLALAEEIASADFGRPRKGNSKEPMASDPSRLGRPASTRGESEAEAKQSQMLWLGTKSGPERKVVEDAGIPFVAIPSAKLRRYFDSRNFLVPFGFVAGCIASLRELRKFHPDVVVTAGGYVGVPVVVAAWMLRVPSLVIQLDLRPGLANLLAAPFVHRIAVAFANTQRFFPRTKTVHTGVPVRKSIRDLGDERIRAQARAAAEKQFSLDHRLPTVLVLGGGTGALRLNELIADCVDEITGLAQIIHLTGPGKLVAKPQARYHPIEFLTEMELAYASADLVVSRAGMGTIGELGCVGLPVILVPLPGTDQERNAKALEAHGAALVIHQNATTPKELAEKILNLLKNETQLQSLAKKIKDSFPQSATERIVGLIENLEPRNENLV